MIRAAVVKDGRTAVLEVEINPGRANRARVNKSVLPRTRDLVGLVRTVVFSPEDLALVKGDPSERRRFLDDLLVLRTPRLAGLRADYDRVLKQRNSLLKTMGPRAVAAPRPRPRCRPWRSGTSSSPSTAPSCSPPGSRSSPTCGRTSARPTRRWPAGASREDAEIDYRSTVPLDGPGDRQSLALSFQNTLAERRKDELDRGALAGRPAPRRPAAHPGAGRRGRREAAGQGLRQPRGVLVVRARAAAGGVRPVARRR